MYLVVAQRQILQSSTNIRYKSVKLLHLHVGVNWDYLSAEQAKDYAKLPFLCRHCGILLLKHIQARDRCTVYEYTQHKKKVQVADPLDAAPPEEAARSETRLHLLTDFANWDLRMLQSFSRSTFLK